MAIDSPTTPTPSFYSNAAAYFRNNGVLLASYWNLLLLTNVVARRIFPSFPEKVALWSSALQKFTGILFVFSSAREPVKSCRDACAFYKKRNLWGVAFSINKVLFQSIDFCLIVGGFTNAVAAASGRPEWRVRFYKFIFPFAVGSQILSVIASLASVAILRGLKANTQFLSQDRDLWESSQLSACDQANHENRTSKGLQRQLNKNFVCSVIDLALPPAFYLSQALGKLKPDSNISLGLTWTVFAISALSLRFRKN